MNHTEILDRSPPHNLDAEKGVLGSILLDPESLDDVRAIVRQPTEFYAYAHQTIYRQLLTLYHAGQAIDVTLLAERLTSAGELDTIGGLDYLAEVINSVPTAANAAYYADIVREKSRLRTVIATATNAIRAAYDSDVSDDIVHRQQQRLDDLTAATIGSEAKPLDVCLAETMDAIDKRIRGETNTGLTTGLSDLDMLLVGLRPERLTIIAGRPGSGKSVLGLQLAAHAALDRRLPVLLVSLEMSRVEVTERLLSARTEINAERITTGRLSNDERRQLVQTQNELADAPLYLDDEPRRTVNEIAAQARRLKRRDGLGLLVIDYLQLIEPDNTRDPRHEQVGRMARRLKGLARELQVPVLCLAQLNREVEKSGTCRPKLSHLRESGSIEQDADVVILVHREELSRPDDADVSGHAELIVAKQRNGRTGVVRTAWDGSTYRFLPMANVSHWSPEAFAVGLSS